MNRLVVPISIAVLLFIMIAAFRMRKKRCCCRYGNCSRCARETFANMKSEVPSFYRIQPIFPKITEKKVFLKKVLL